MTAPTEFHESWVELLHQFYGVSSEEAEKYVSLREQGRDKEAEELFLQLKLWSPKA